MKLHRVTIFFLHIFWLFFVCKSETKLFILSGPSGVGKTTIVNQLISQNIAQFFPTTTTRSMRVGETHGIDYFFINKQDFESRLSDFFKPQLVFDNWYGPDQKLLQEQLKISNKPIIMVVTFNLALDLKNAFQDQVITVFIAPPKQNSEQILRSRMLNRGESEESIVRRLKNLDQELSEQNKADYVIINDNVLQTCDILIKIFTLYQ